MNIDVVIKIKKLAELSESNPEYGEEPEISALKYIASEALDRGDLFPEDLIDWIRGKVSYGEGREHELLVYLEHYIKGNPYLSDWTVAHYNYVNKEFWT